MPNANSKKALIIGNGFDLAHGLPTSYGDFITFIKILKTYSGDWANVAFRDLFIEQTTDSIGFKSEWLNAIKEHYDIDDLHFDLTTIQDKLDNAWLNCFEPVHEIETWIDFELEIKKILEIVADFLKFGRDKFNNGRSFEIISYLDALVDKPLHTFNHARCIKLSYLKLIDGYKIANDFSGQKTPANSKSAERFEIASKFIKTYEPSLKALDGSSVIDFLLHELNLFIELFSNYLLQVVNKISLEVKKETLNISIDYDEIYSFNYTNTIGNLYRKSEVSYYFLHGSLQDKNIVLGVDEIETEMLGVAALGFTKYFQTLFKKSQSAFLDELECLAQNFVGVDYYIWGHSLDLSDSKYIKRLFNELSFELANSNKIAYESMMDSNGNQFNLPESTVTVYYHDESSRAKLLKNLLDIIGKEFIEKYIHQGFLRFEKSPEIWKS